MPSACNLANSTSGEDKRASKRSPESRGIIRSAVKELGASALGKAEGCQLGRTKSPSPRRSLSSHFHSVRAHAELQKEHTITTSLAKIKFTYNHLRTTKIVPLSLIAGIEPCVILPQPNPKYLSRIQKREGFNITCIIPARKRGQTTTTEAHTPAAHPMRARPHMHISDVDYDCSLAYRLYHSYLQHA